MFAGGFDVPTLTPSTSSPTSYSVGPIQPFKLRMDHLYNDDSKEIIGPRAGAVALLIGCSPYMQEAWIPSPAPCKLSVAHIPVVPALVRGRQEDLEFKGIFF